MYAQTKFTKPQIENGHFVMCVGTFIERNHLFWPRIHISHPIFSALVPRICPIVSDT